MYLEPAFAITSSTTPTEEFSHPVLKVVGVGGGGCNAVARMMELGMRGVDFIAMNTDQQALKSNPAPTKILLGPATTHGFGAGGNPEVGRAAARESKEAIQEALAGADMVFLTAGMGGGTGTGAMPVVAEVSRAIGAVTIAIVTTPFSFEMGQRWKNAQMGLSQLRDHTHTLITIPNDRLLFVAPRDLPLESAFCLADDVLRQAVQGVTELITEPGLINVDFSHIRRLILQGGGALMSIGQGQGEKKVLQALDQALHHPLVDSVSLANAAGVIANFTGGSDLSLLEVQSALSLLQTETGEDTEIVFGVVNDESMQGRAQAILMITGLGAPTLEETMGRIRKPAPKEERVEMPEVAEEVESEPVKLRLPSFRQPSTSTHSPSNYELPAFLRFRNL